MSSVVFPVVAATNESKALLGTDARSKPRLENVGKFPKVSSRHIFKGRVRKAL